MKIFIHIYPIIIIIIIIIDIPLIYLNLQPFTLVDSQQAQRRIPWYSYIQE